MTPRPDQAEPVDVRLWRKVDRSGGPDSCWLWTDRQNVVGYGRMKVGSRTDGSMRGVLAHRLAYSFTYGDIPVGLDVLHQCDAPACCNPAHLRVGTHKDNMDDRGARGRTSRGFHSKGLWGQRAPAAKLTDGEVIEIERRVRAGERQQGIARDYGITRSNVGLIGQHKTWLHLWEDKEPRAARAGEAVPPIAEQRPL